MTYANRPAAARFERLTICARCVRPGDERLGTKLSFVEITCARCDRVLESAIVVQVLTALRRGTSVAGSTHDGTSAAGLRKGPPGDALSPKERDTAAHGASPAYADLSNVHDVELHACALSGVVRERIDDERLARLSGRDEA